MGRLHFSKTNRPRHSLFPETLAAFGFYGIGAQKMQTVGIQFSIKIPTTEYLEEYSSGDVCERCLRQSKRAKRSGCGRNSASVCELRISGTATGHNGAPRFCPTLSMFCAFVAQHIWRRIEVVITGLTRNQFAGNGTWVRIPPSPPKRKHTPSGVCFRLSRIICLQQTRLLL